MNPVPEEDWITTVACNGREGARTFPLMTFFMTMRIWLWPFVYPDWLSMSFVIKRDMWHDVPGSDSVARLKPNSLHRKITKQEKEELPWFLPNESWTGRGGAAPCKVMRLCVWYVNGFILIIKYCPRNTLYSIILLWWGIVPCRGVIQDLSLPALDCGQQRT